MIGETRLHPTPRSLAIQAAIVFFAVGFLTYVTGHYNFRTGANVLWMAGIPVTTAMIANPDAQSRMLVGLVLTVIAFASVCFSGEFFGLM